MIDLSKAVAIDIETTGLAWYDRVLTISLAKPGDEEPQTLVLNIGYEQRANLFGVTFGADADVRDREIRPLGIPEARLAFQTFIQDASVVIYHNGSFDIPFIIRSGIQTAEELDSYQIFDTMVMARCTRAHDSVSLKNLLKDYEIQTDPEWDKTKELRAKLAEVPWDKVEHYSRMDAVYTLQLAQEMIPLAQSYYSPEFLAEESDWVKLISLMRVNGIQTDIEGVKKVLAQKKQEQDALYRELQSYRIKGPNHRTSIKGWVAGIGQTNNLDVTEKGNISLNDVSLRKLRGDAVPVVNLILKSRHLDKEISTWVEAPLEHADTAGRIHPHFIVSGAKSNRLSCKEPSAHTFPKALEDVLMTAAHGYRLVSLDYKAAEARIAASYSQEQVLADEFAKPDADPHTAMAVQIWGESVRGDREMRRKAKNSFFSSIYGGGVFALMSQANKGVDPAQQIDEDEGKAILSAFRARMTGIAKTQKQAEHVWLTRGYLTVLGGKRLYASRWDLEKSYKAFNFLIQPSVAELIKKAMIRIWRELPEVILVSQKHDSVFMEIPDDQYFDERIAKIQAIMVEVYPDDLRSRTDPPINMDTDMEMDKPGLPYPAEGA